MLLHKYKYKDKTKHSKKEQLFTDGAACKRLVKTFLLFFTWCNKIHNFCDNKTGCTFRDHSVFLPRCTVKASFSPRHRPVTLLAEKFFRRYPVSANVLLPKGSRLDRKLCYQVDRANKEWFEVGYKETCILSKLHYIYDSIALPNTKVECSQTITMAVFKQNVCNLENKNKNVLPMLSHRPPLNATQDKHFLGHIISSVITI